MSDEKLRELERRWRETQDAAAGMAWVEEELRARGAPILAMIAQGVTSARTINELYVHCRAGPINARELADALMAAYSRPVLPEDMVAFIRGDGVPMVPAAGVPIVEAAAQGLTPAAAARIAVGNCPRCERAAHLGSCRLVHLCVDDGPAVCCGADYDVIIADEAQTITNVLGQVNCAACLREYYPDAAELRCLYCGVQWPRSPGTRDMPCQACGGRMVSLEEARCRREGCLEHGTLRQHSGRVFCDAHAHLSAPVCIRVCKVCHASCRPPGEIEHGRGCYQLREEGGGLERCEEEVHDAHDAHA
jgi:hypothetical protein